MKRVQTSNGYTLVEILVVILVFSILGLITTQTLSTTLRSSGKSENTVVVRENVNYAMGVMERNIRNAEEIISCSSNSISYKNPSGIQHSFTCSSAQINSSELAGSLTSNEVNINSDCSTPLFTCNLGQNFVDITINAVDSQSASTGDNALTTNVDETIRVKIRDY